MKTATTALINFLLDAQEFVRADLYTFTLIGGGVLRYVSCSMPITYDGAMFNVGPPISDAGVQNSRGTNAGSVDVTVLGDERFLVNGEQVLDFVENLGLDGATVRIDRVFAASWSAMAVSGPVGGYCRFSGRVSEPKELGVTQVVITATDYRDCLNQPFPADVYQTACLNVFGDPVTCGVDVAALTVSGTVASGSWSQTSFGSNLTQADSYFTLGVVEFTSGANSGISRSAKLYTHAGGAFQLTSPVPETPAAGDTFTAAPGCSLALSSSAPNGCQQWQPSTYLERYRGFPFIPPPSTGLST
jgi:hypothetical protein